MPLSETPETNNPPDFRAFFAKRNKLTEDLNIELTDLANQLSKLIPPELTTFKDRFFPDLPAWLNEVEYYANMSVPHIQFIKDPTIYDFADLNDAKTKLEQLKTAWEGVINIQLSEDRDGLTLLFSLPSS